QLPGPVLPLICIPTTAGTGSEVSGASVLTDSEKHMKVGVLSNYLRPRVAVVDPMLTVSCPPKVTADSGIDALTHAVEAYTAVDNADFPLPAGERSVYQGRHPMRNLLAEKATALIGEDVRGLTEHESAELAVAAVDRLRHDTGVPGRLRDLGVQPSQLRAFAEKAESIKRILRVNPRTPTAAEIEAIYQAAY